MKRVLIVGNNETCRNANYFKAVEAVGLEAVQCNFDFPLEELASCDGVLLPGGVDLNPCLYEQENTASFDVNDTLDKIEYSVIKKALELNKVIFGICRGLQILNVYFGGTLQQNVAHCEIHKCISSEEDRVHDTEVVENYFIHSIYKSKHIAVNSAHHQAVEQLGKGLIATQFSCDGIVEALVHESLPVFAVQWHPERMCLEHARQDTVSGLPLFEYFASLL